jgi:hypothetical protein
MLVETLNSEERKFVLYARDQAGNLVEPAPKRVGYCSLCAKPLIPRCGTVNRWHWGHRARDCDSWSEGETEWHLGWKRRAPSSWCEVSMPPHRADIRRSDKLVIELQQSSISAVDIAAREQFYGDMWWLFHRSRMGKNAMFFRLADGRIRMRWLSGSRTLPRVTKPIFCDLGGPVVAFEGRLDERGGYGRLVSRLEFMELAQLRALDANEKRAFSHLEFEYPNRQGKYMGRLVSSMADVVRMTESDRFNVFSAVRADGTRWEGPFVPPGLRWNRISAPRSLWEPALVEEK